MTKLEEEIKDGLEENVKDGAAYLDLHRPGWFLDIDLDTLDVGSTGNCPLGQLYGTYEQGQHATGLWDSVSMDLGFDIPCYPAPSGLIAYWNSLWKVEIRNRLNRV